MPTPRRPATIRRKAGRLAFAVLLAGASGTAAPASPAAAQADRFLLKIDIAMLGHPASMHFTQCLGKGRPYTWSGRDGFGFSWDGRFSVVPAADGTLEVHADLHSQWQDLRGHVRNMAGRPTVRTPAGHAATLVFGQKQGAPPADGSVQFELTPQAGCDGLAPAKATGPASLHRVVRNQSARAVAGELARAGGFTLLNPQAISERPVSFRFEDVSPIPALQLVADIDGERATFDGWTVRFDPK